MSTIAVIGYGRMGQIIHQLALQKGHKVPLTIDVTTEHQLQDLGEHIDVAIEFTGPESAFDNLKTCLQMGIPVVCGTTGWLDRMDEIKALRDDLNGSLFYASNYSMGVNLFFALNRYLAKQMNSFPNYDVRMTETHHKYKLDAPSGTAITLAQGILDELDRKSQWINGAPKESDDDLQITSRRINETPGIHLVDYHSEVDSIEIKHTAHSRAGFALGAISAAEWLIGKQGFFGMKDLLGF